MHHISALTTRGTDQRQYVQLNFTANVGRDAAQLSEFEVFP